MTPGRRSGFEFVCKLPLGYSDGRARLCVVRMRYGEHEQILLTHPVKPPAILDMQAKTFRPLLP
jgi:hypothetical protein